MNQQAAYEQKQPRRRDHGKKTQPTDKEKKIKVVGKEKRQKNFGRLKNINAKDALEVFEELENAEY